MADFLPKLGHALRLLVGSTALLIVALWTLCAVAFSEVLPHPVPLCLAGLLLAGGAMLFIKSRERSVAVGVLLCVWVVVATLWQFKSPSLDRTWAPDHERLAAAHIDGSIATVRNLRDATYRTPTDYTVRYYDETFDLDALERVWFIMDRFSTFEGAAHTFLSFGFKDGKYVCISVEARREVDEAYHPLGGMFKQYELVYILGSERDVIGRRTNAEASDVWMYPVKTDAAGRRALFVAMLERANTLREKPAWYHTFARSCNSSIVDHVRTLVPGSIPFDLRLLLPGYAAEMAFELDLVDTELSFEEGQRVFAIGERARQAPPDEGFSQRIRRDR